jgi:hypothetical protein
LLPAVKSYSACIKSGALNFVYYAVAAIFLEAVQHIRSGEAAMAQGVAAKKITFFFAGFILGAPLFRFLLEI